MATQMRSTPLTRAAGLRRIQSTLANLRWPTLGIAALFAPLIIPESFRQPFFVLLGIIVVYNLILTLALRLVPLAAINWVGYFSVAGDTIFLSIAIWATGGFYSPLHVAYYAIAISVAIFFGRWEALFAGVFYASCYALAITAANGPDVWPQVYGEFGLRVIFLLLASLFVGQLAEDRLSLSTINDQLQGEIRQRERIEGTLRAMNAAATTVQSTLDPSAIFHALSRELRDLDLHVGVLNYDPADGSLTLAYTSIDGGALSTLGKLTFNDPYSYRIQPRANGYFVNAIATKDAVFFDSMGDMIRDLVSGPMMQLVTSALSVVPTGKVIVAPMVVQDMVTGVLGVAGPQLTRADIPAVTAFANQIAIALETARLVEDLRMSLDELRTTQAQLIQSAKMASVGTLAAGVAHEINNPLLALSGRAEQLLARSDQYLANDRAVQYVTVIRDMAERLTNIVRALLAFSRAGTGDFEPFDVNAAIDDTLQLVDHQLRETNVDLRREFGEGVVVDGNKNQLQQVFMNLVINARDAMPAGGVLRIATERRNGQQNDVVVRVSDTGSGMPPEVMARIFDPFYTTKEVGRGTGLGLFVTRGIVDRHNGVLDVTSAPGQGTTFQLTIPATRSLDGGGSAPKDG